MMNKILLVDDDINLSRVWEKWLTKAGYKVVVVNDPKDVPTLIEKEKPQLILLDVLMPGTDGIQLAIEIKNNDYSGSLTIIMMSAIYKHHDIKVHARGSVSDFLSKPFDQKTLIAKVNQYLPIENSTTGGSETPVDVPMDIPGENEIFAGLFDSPPPPADPRVERPKAEGADGFEIQFNYVDPTPGDSSVNQDETLVTSIPEMKKKAGTGKKPAKSSNQELDDLINQLRRS